MGLEKLGMSLARKTSAWLKACGKNSVLQTKPIKTTEIQVLKYKPELKTDTFVKKVDSWMEKLPEGYSTPYCMRGETMVNDHHNFHSYNGFCNSTFEERIKHLEHLKNKNYNRYKERIQEEMEEFDYQTELLLKDNASFTKLTPQPRDCVAYRGVNRRIGAPRQDYDVINSANVGDIIIPTRGYAYAAHYKLGAKQYMGSAYNIEGQKVLDPMLIEYRIPKGSQISSNMEHGGEVVFPALSKFKLISREDRLIEKLDYHTGTVIGSEPYKRVILEYIPEIPLLTNINKFIG